MLGVGRELLASAFGSQCLSGPRAITLNEENLKENILNLERLEDVSERGMIEIINSLKRIQVPENVTKNFETYNGVKQFIMLLIVSTHPDRDPRYLELSKIITKYKTYLDNYVREFHNNNFDTKVKVMRSAPEEAAQRPSRRSRRNYEMTSDTVLAELYAVNSLNKRVLRLETQPLEFTDAVFKEMIYSAKNGAHHNQYETIFMPKSSGVHELGLVAEFLDNLKPGTKKMHIVMTRTVLPMELAKKVRAKAKEMRKKFYTNDIHVYFTKDLMKT